MITLYKASPYFELYKDKHSFTNEKEICNFINKNLQFSYGKVDYNQYQQKCQLDEALLPTKTTWLRKKVISLPAAMWCVLIKTIYHFAKAIILGSFKACFGDTQYFQAHCYYLARDFQESFGWIASLFKWRYGQFHVHESQFHQSCYENYLSHKKSQKKEISTNNFESSLLNQFTSHQAPKAIEKVLPVAPAEKTFTPNHPLSTASQQIVSISLVTSNANLDRELDRIKKISNSTEKEKCLVHLSEVYLQKGDPEKALETIQEVVFDTKAKNDLFEMIATFYFKQGDLRQSFRIIKRTCDKKKEEPLIKNIATAYLNQDEPNKALEAIKHIYFDKKIKETFIENVATYYFDKEDFDHAFETIGYTLSDQKEEDLIEKIATFYLNKGNLEKSLKWVKEIYVDQAKRESFILKIATSYFNQGNLEKAFETIQQIFNDPKTKEDFIEKIGEGYLNKKEPKKAFEVIESIPKFAKLKAAFLVKIAQLYFMSADEQNATEILYFLAKSALLRHLLKHPQTRADCLKMMTKNKHIEVETFFRTLAKKCYWKTEELFLNKFDTKKILNQIKKEAIEPQKIQEFLNLKKKVLCLK